MAHYPYRLFLGLSLLSLLCFGLALASCHWARSNGDAAAELPPEAAFVQFYVLHISRDSTAAVPRSQVKLLKTVRGKGQMKSGADAHNDAHRAPLAAGQVAGLVNRGAGQVAGPDQRFRHYQKQIPQVAQLCPNSTLRSKKVSCLLRTSLQVCGIKPRLQHPSELIDTSIGNPERNKPKRCQRLGKDGRGNKIHMPACERHKPVGRAE